MGVTIPHQLASIPMDLTAARKNARTAADAQAIAFAQDRIEELETTLGEARLQLEYLSEKFGQTGSGNTVLARISMALAGSATYESELSPRQETYD